MLGADQASFPQCCSKKLQIDPGMVLMTKNLLSVSFYLCKHDLLSICNLYLVNGQWSWSQYRPEWDDVICRKLQPFVCQLPAQVCLTRVMVWVVGCWWCIQHFGDGDDGDDGDDGHDSDDVDDRDDGDDVDDSDDGDDVDDGDDGDDSDNVGDSGDRPKAAS